jgi:hypothetical protein
LKQKIRQIKHNFPQSFKNFYHKSHLNIFFQILGAPPKKKNHPRPRKFPTQSKFFEKNILNTAKKTKMKKFQKNAQNLKIKKNCVLCALNVEKEANILIINL